MRSRAGGQEADSSDTTTIECLLRKRGGADPETIAAAMAQSAVDLEVVVAPRPLPVFAPDVVAVEKVPPAAVPDYVVAQEPPSVAASDRWLQDVTESSIAWRARLNASPVVGPDRSRQQGRGPRQQWRIPGRNARLRRTALRQLTRGVVAARELPSVVAPNVGTADTAPTVVPEVVVVERPSPDAVCTTADLSEESCDREVAEATTSAPSEKDPFPTTELLCEESSLSPSLSPSHSLESPPSPLATPRSTEPPRLHQRLSHSGSMDTGARYSLDPPSASDDPRVALAMARDSSKEVDSRREGSPRPTATYPVGSPGQYYELLESDEASYPIPHVQRRRC